LQLAELEQRVTQAERPGQTITYERAAARKKHGRSGGNLLASAVVETIELVPEAVQQEPELYERSARSDLRSGCDPAETGEARIVRPKYRHGSIAIARAGGRGPPRVVPGATPPRACSRGSRSASTSITCAVPFGTDVVALGCHDQPPHHVRLGRGDRGLAAAIYRQMHRGLLAGNYLQADETPVRCNDPDEKRGGTTQGYLWVISRPGADVVFDWRLSRRQANSPR